MMVSDGPSGLRKQADKSDALGLNQSVEAINFPASCLTACSFDREALTSLGTHLGIAAKSEQVGVLLGPAINMKRSPLAGRNFEYFSEDPYLAGELGAAYVKGVQGEHVGVSVKHFAGNNRENQRFTASSDIDERTLREIYLKAFEKIVKEASPATIMCSYNPLNGVLNSQNDYLLNDILREEWGFDGLVLSDWGAVADHVASIKAGLDLEMPGNGNASEQEIINAIKTGSLSMDVLDTAVLRVLKLIQTYGPNDTEKINPYDKEKHHQFAREIAANSMVLLKNNNAILPIKKDDSVLIVGDLAENPRYQGGGSSHVNAFRVSSPLEEIQARQSNTQFAKGYDINEDTENISLTKEAISKATTVDKVIIFAGYPEQMESEGYDKDTIQLPENQTKLIKEMSKANPNLVLVLQNGSPLLMPWVEEVKAILETYLPGEAVGEATWDVLSGQVNPSGKLAETFPKELEENPTSMTFDSDLSHEVYHEGLFIGYRYYDKKKLTPLFPFGHGLSYTTFSFQSMKIKQTTTNVKVTVTIKNTGTVLGSEVIQLYCSNLTSKIEKPIKELRDFAKVSLKPNEEATIDFLLDIHDFAWYNAEQSKWQTDNGTYNILVGSSSRNLPLSEAITLSLGKDIKHPVTSNTYLSEIISRDDLSNALEQSGIGAILTSLTKDKDTSKMLENIPLRAIEMMGCTQQQIESFIKLAN